ncbi:MAG: hypothetical protein HYS52_01415 [Candidatus Wildermuthbacteria bacterium]|nr:hypothetical protein [Candidatus Wildermuthbacteria bacterium]
MVEIIPKTQPKNIFALNSVAVLFMLLAGVAMGFLAFWYAQGTTRANIQSIEQQLGIRQTAQELALEKEVLGQAAKIRDLKYLLGSRTDTLPFLQFLEDSIHPKVVVTDFALSPAARSMMLSAEAQDFGVVEEQLLAFQQGSKAPQVRLADLTIGKQGASKGAILFQVEISFPTL